MVAEARLYIDVWFFSVWGCLVGQKNERRALPHVGAFPTFTQDQRR